MPVVSPETDKRIIPRSIMPNTPNHALSNLVDHNPVWSAELRYSEP